MSELACPSFFTRLILSWTSRRNRRELELFAEAISTVPPRDLAEILLCVGMIRRDLESQGLHPLDPFTLAMFEKPGIATLMAAQSQQFNRQKKIIPAAAFSVWGHTFRASVDHSLLPAAKLMWQAVLRGKPELPEAAERVLARDGVLADPVNAAVVPTGFG